MSFAYNSGMQFELTEELIDEILFFMEDQEGEFYVDALKGIVISFDNMYSCDDKNDDDDDDGNRFISLPEWEPSDGYRLMEGFAAGLRNNVIREELSGALDRGRGVFRAFKDTIAKYPEVEKLWFAYKDREMKREVIQWYNALREQWGMELIGEEPEDIEDIALEDFRYREGGAADCELAEKLHGNCVKDAECAAEPGRWVFPGDLCVVAESAGGEFAAYVSAVKAETGGLHVNALEVMPEYRGLGIGKALLGRLLEKADNMNISVITIDLPAESENFSRTLYRENFKSVVTRFCRKNTKA